MKIEDAFENLFNYYCGDEDDHHDYIRESWQTLKSNIELINKRKAENHCKVCRKRLQCSRYGDYPECGILFPVSNTNKE